jgi:hypothetical protein
MLQTDTTLSLTALISVLVVVGGCNKPLTSNRDGGSDGALSANTDAGEPSSYCHSRQSCTNRLTPTADVEFCIDFDETVTAADARSFCDPSLGYAYQDLPCAQTGTVGG